METSKNPLISVIMLNYNGLSYLKHTIQPILDQDYPNYEFIIVDNGSTDGSIEYIKKNKKIKLIESPKKREKNFACNFAIKQCAGEFILLLDNDALLTKKELLGELLEEHSAWDNVGAIGLSFVNLGSIVTKGYGSYFCHYFICEQPNISVDMLPKYHGKQIGFPSGGGLFIRKEDWEKVGGYDDHLVFGGDDNDLGLKLWLMGYKNYLHAKELQIHLGLPERQDTKKYSLKLKEMSYAHLYTIVKNYSFFNMLVCLFGTSLFNFLKSLKQALLRHNAGCFFAFFQGYWLFLKNLPVALRKRSKLQSARIVKSDIFLKIKPGRTDF